MSNPAGDPTPGDNFETRAAKIVCQLNSAAEEIEFIYNYSKKAQDPTTASTSSKSNVKGMAMMLENFYKKYEASWVELSQLYVGNGRASEFPSDQDKKDRGKVRSNYYSATGTIELLKSEELSKLRPDSSNLTLQTQKPLKSLPRLNLPTFDGQPVNWAIFRDSFTSMVHNEDLPVIEKFQYLRASLKGAALSTIASFKIEEANYQLAWQALMDVYDNKRLLASAYLEQMLNFKPIQGKGTLDSLNQFLSSVCDNVSAFRCLDIREESQFILFYLAARCLDSHSRELFESGRRKDEFPTFDALTSFVRDRITSLQLSTNTNPLNVPETPSRQTNLPKHHKFTRPPYPKERPASNTSLIVNKPGGLHNVSNSKIKGNNFPSSNSNRDQPCILCNGGAHVVSRCPLFIDATPMQRRNLLKDWTGCVNCLSSRHKLPDCPSKWTCRFCSERHHSNLHSAQPTGNAAQRGSSSSTPATLTLSTVAPSQSSILLGTAVARIYDARGQLQSLRMVIDCGSQHSFITHKCLDKLGLKMSRTDRLISGIGQTMFAGAKGKASCLIKPRNDDTVQLYTEAIVVPTITSNLPSMVLPHSVVEKCMGLNLADPHFWKPGRVDFLLGADLFTKICLGIAQETDANGPDIIPSIFGFIIMGRFQADTLKTSMCFIGVGNSDVNFQLERFWELEQPSATSRLLQSPQDLECEEHFARTHQRLPTGRYVVRLPFCSEQPHLGDSSPAVLRRLYSLERKLDKDPIMKQKYHEFMEEYLHLGHMSPADTPAKYMIPHHCITRDSNEGTKIKAVFDASSRAPNGSLNDHLLTGTKLQNDVVSVIHHFRQHRIAFSTDIVKMFRMISIHPADRPYLQIYWRFNESEPVTRFTLNTVIYGLVCAPFLAQRVLKQLVLDHGEAYPEAARAILEHSYVDDILTGAPSFSAAVNLRDQLINLLRHGGFELSKWTSNSPDILPKQTETPGEPVDLSSPEEQWVKVLGLQWDPKTDAFCFSSREPNANFTKRGVLSTVARLYDPLGFLTPVTFLMKTVIQDLWAAKLDWDEDLNPASAATWREITAELPSLSKVRIPRCVVPLEGATSCQFIGFSDASARGYAAILFLKVLTPGDSQISLVAAKSKLAPTNTQSIPRLELSGALLLAELYAAVIPHALPDGLKVDPPALFTDSTIVLAWIATLPHKLKVFVANRVAKIRELTSSSSWRHIISESNPADIGSRGALPSQLITHNLWWAGPPWISSPVEQWPTSTLPLPVSIPEMKTPESPVLISTTRHFQLTDWISRFSSFSKLARSSGWLRRWLHNISHQQETTALRSGQLKRCEVDEGIQMCIRATQTHYFHNESQTKEHYKAIQPFLDPKGLWRVGGRLAHSSLPESQRHPILLPHNAHLSAILVDHYHRLYLHPGPTTLQAIIQRQYWIPSLRRLIRARGFKCKRCYISRASPVTPLMGDLPNYRVNGGRVFQHVGIDFGGPFPLKESNRRNAPVGKVYLCLYICMATRALHLEAVTKLTTEAFLASLTRFTSRRGIPSDIYTDNGSNFLGAANYLKELYSWFSSKETKQDILNYAIDTKINWHFNPPQTPHMGGLWEAGVKSVKRHMRLIASNAHLTYEEITTWFSKVEAILNSRPLCPLSTDPTENDYLSPGHFLVGGPLVVNPEPSLLDLRENLLSKWQLVTKMSEEFWERWSSEYLVSLQKRPKWFDSKPNLAVGDLVLLKDKLPPLQWKLARVIAVHPGADGVVRVVTVRCKTATLSRHVVNLVPLPHLSIPSYSGTDAYNSKQQSPLPSH